MAYSASNLKKIAGGATGIFYYDSTDAIGTIDDADYFLGATNELKVGDIIIAVGSTGGTRTVDLLVVQTNTGTGLTTVLGT
tara:strand:- start:60 stop:302 length:243 start_codon:yes stop_codon:yes gene_type:complete